MNKINDITIVLVEDDPGHAKLIERNLRRALIKNPIISIENGRKALDFIFKKTDKKSKAELDSLLILLDLNLPEVDGYQVLKELKSNESTKHIPVIVLTSTEDQNEINRCYRLGCNVFITKPVDYSQFADAITKLGLFVLIVKLSNGEFDASVCLLYMEDDPGIANLCKKYLERKDYTVTIAPDGKKGLELYKKRAFDVILVDHDLPVYSGLEVIRKLKEYDDVPPVIMITGQGSESLAVEAMKLGASDYLIKDVEGRYLDMLPGVIGKIVYEKLLLESKLEAEKTVLDNERKIKNILNTIVDGVATINRNGIIDSVNPAVEKLFGYSSEELIGQNVKILMPEPYFREHDNYLSRFQKTGKKQIIGIGREVQGKRKDGTIFPLYLAVSETEINNEKMYTGILHDITEQKEAEDKIKRLKTGIDQAYDAVMITDLDGSIHYVNPAFEAMTGYTKDEVLGKNPRFLKSGKHSDEFYKDLWDTINKGKIWKSLIKNKRKDGTLYDEEISIAPVKE
ncbi:PAS domain S-box protein [candidate division KSB1 bacterium]|nr:PAS domain S-box protein [candidate division KSB1 bacterium]